MAKKTLRFRKKKKHKINDKKQPTKKGKGLLKKIIDIRRTQKILSVKKKEEEEEKKQKKQKRKKEKKVLEFTPPLEILSDNLAHKNLKLKPEPAHKSFNELKKEQRNMLDDMLQKKKL